MGNTAYHYAALGNFPELAIIFDNTGSGKKIRYVIENKEGKKPLDICCENGNLEVFNAMWARAGKSNHAPIKSLKYACIGKNEVVIKTLLNHPKFKENRDKYELLYEEVLNNKYGTEVKTVFINILQPKTSYNLNRFYKAHIPCEKVKTEKILTNQSNLKIFN